MATTRKTANSARKTGGTARANAGSAKRSSPAKAPKRDSNGRFKADHHIRNAAVGGAVLVGAVAAGVAAAFKFGLLDRMLPAGEGHGAEDLLLDDHPDADHRAPAAVPPRHGRADVQGRTRSAAPGQAQAVAGRCRGRNREPVMPENCQTGSGGGT